MLALFRGMLVFIVTLLTINTSHAWVRGGKFYPKTNINVNLPTAAPGIYVNVLHNCGPFANVAANFSVDTNGYPNNSTTYLSCNSNWLLANTQYTLIFPATRTGSITFGNGITSCINRVNATIVSGCSGTFVTVSQTSGATAMRMTFTTTATALGNVSFAGLNGTGLLSGSGEIAIIRTSDCLRFTGTSDCSGTSIVEYLTSEVVDMYKNLHPKALRFMPWTNTGGSNLNSESKWSYRRTLNTLNWSSGANVPPGAFAPSAISGTDVYTVNGAPDTPLTWTDGEVLIGAFTNANTFTTYSAEADDGTGQIKLTVASSSAFSNGQRVAVTGGNDNDIAQYQGPIWTITVPDSTHIILNGSIYSSICAACGGNVNVVPTIDIKTPGGVSRGAKDIVSGGFPLSGNALVASSNSNTFYTLIYNATLDKVLLNSGTSASMIPLEAQIHLANLVGADFWGIIPAYVTDDYVTNYAQTVLANLNPNLKFMVEYSNEVWNFGFPQWGFATQVGRKLGFPFKNSEENLGWYGLRTRQIFGNLMPPIWTGANAARLQRVHAWQAGGDVNVLTYSMKGGDLVNNKAYSLSPTLTCGAQTKVTSLNSGLQNGWPVTFTGSLCTGMSSATTYYVVNAMNKNTDSYYISASQGGVPISTSGTASGVTATYTNPYYASTINADYSALPNRPIDVAEWGAYAPYTGGSAFFYGADIGYPYPQVTTWPSPKVTAVYQSVVDSYNNGDVAGAVATIKNDILDGVLSTATIASVSGNVITTTAPHGLVVNANIIFKVTGGTCYSGLSCNNYQLYQVDSASLTSTTFIAKKYNADGHATGSQATPGTPGSGTVTIGWIGGACNSGCSSWPYPANKSLAYALPFTVNTYMQFGEWLAASMDGDRPSGMANLKNAWYEGALEFYSPYTSMYSIIGLTGTNPQAALEASILAAQNDQSFADLQKTFFKQFMGTDSSIFNYGTMLHSVMPAHYTVTIGPRSTSQSWAIVSGSEGSTPYSLYYGIQQYNVTNSP